MAIPQSTKYEFEDEELNEMKRTGISCDRLRQALKKCIKESYCVQVQARSAKECIDAHDGSVSERCFSLLQNFTDCKRFSMLELGRNSVAFEPETLRNGHAGNSTQNFFDDVNLMICTVRNNGSLGITAKSLAEADVISARTKDRGPPGLMKLSPNRKLAILQRQKNSVDIVMLEKNDGTVAAEFNIAPKSKDMILSVDWITNNQILLVTKQSLEIFSLNEDKATAKLLRNLNISASWSIYCAKSTLVILATGNNCATLQPFLVQYGQFTRLKSFDVDLCTPSSDNLLEKDVIISCIYGKICVMVLQYSACGSPSTDLLIYELLEDVNCGAKLKYSLILGICEINDIRCGPLAESTHTFSTDDCFNQYVFSIFGNLLILFGQHYASNTIEDPLGPSPVCQPPPALYVPLWSMFQPDIVVDPVAGMMYQLTVCCSHAHEEIHDKCMLIEFLIHRTNQKALVLSTLLLCLKRKLLQLRQIRRLFNLIVEKFTLYLKLETNQPDSTKPHLITTNVEHLRIEQREMHSNIFIPYMEDSSSDPKFVADILLQYLRSLHSWEVPVENYLLELVVESLALSGEMIKLHQLVTYRCLKVVSDSKPLAFLLLSYEARCPSLFQAGLDILARQKACDEIVEVLLERRNVIDAIRYLDAQQLETNSWKLIDTAKNQSRVVQYAVLANLINRKDKDNMPKLETELTALYTEDEIKCAVDEESKVM